MYEQVEKSKENKSRAIANSVSQKRSNGMQGVGIVDKRFTKLTRGAKQNELTGIGNVPVQRVEYKKSFESMAIGVEQELSSVYIKKSEMTSHLIASVKSDKGEPLVEITTDLPKGDADQDGTRDYTVELITHPVEHSNKKGVEERWIAFNEGIIEIQRAAKKKQSITTSGKTDKGLVLSVNNAEHTVHYNVGSEHVDGSGIQATISVPLKDIGTGTGGGKYIENAPWYKADIGSEVSDSDYINLDESKKMYIYVMSVLRHFVSLVDRFKIRFSTINSIGKYQENNKSMQDPDVKNAWGILPRTNVWKTLDTLSNSQDKEKLKEIIEEAPKEYDKELWSIVIKYVKNGNGFVGSAPINDATVGGKHSPLFEYRSESDIPSAFQDAIWKPGEKSKPDKEKEEKVNWEDTNNNDVKVLKIKNGEIHIFKEKKDKKDERWWAMNTRTGEETEKMDTNKFYSTGWSSIE